MAAEREHQRPVKHFCPRVEDLIDDYRKNRRDFQTIDPPFEAGNVRGETRLVFQKKRGSRPLYIERGWVWSGLEWRECTMVYREDDLPPFQWTNSPDDQEAAFYFVVPCKGGQGILPVKEEMPL